METHKAYVKPYSVIFNNEMKNYADEEMYRWSHALLRHYVVEGQKEMLSKKYGFSYVPGHIENNDFADGLKGWTVNEAEKGSVGTAYNKELNHRNQNRWGGAGDIGNTFCTLKAVAGTPLSQQRKYCPRTLTTRKGCSGE